MLSYVITIVGGSRPPVMTKLLLRFSATDPVEMHILALVCRGTILLLTTLRDVMLSVCISVGDCGCPMAIRACLAGIALRKLM